MEPFHVPTENVVEVSKPISSLSRSLGGIEYSVIKRVLEDTLGDNEDSRPSTGRPSGKRYFLFLKIQMLFSRQTSALYLLMISGCSPVF